MLRQDVLTAIHESSHRFLKVFIKRNCLPDALVNEERVFESWDSRAPFLKFTVILLVFQVPRVLRDLLKPKIREIGDEYGTSALRIVRHCLLVIHRRSICLEGKNSFTLFEARPIVLGF